MFSESVLCGENKSKASGGVMPPLKPAWLLCLLSGGWQVNSLSLEHSALPREPCRLNVPKTAPFSPFTELLSLDPPALETAQWAKCQPREMAGDPRLPGSMKKPSILRSRGQQTSYSYKNENKRFTKAGCSRVRITLPSHFHSFGFSGSSALGPNALRRWFLWTLSTILGGWWGVRGRVPREETDQRQVPGSWACSSAQPQSRPWVSPFSVFCPHASFLSPPVAQPRSCQTSFSHLCALPLTLDFMALFLPQGPAFWKEGCFLHQAHHQNHLGVFIKTRNALPKTEVLQCLLETLIHGPGGGQGTRSFFV